MSAAKCEKSAPAWTINRHLKKRTSLRTLRGVHVADLRPLGNYLVEAIEAELRAEGLRADTFSALEPDSVQLAKTASRSTLGFMTEMAFELGWIIADTRGPRRSDINDLNHALRRMLWNRGNYVRPIELVHRRLNVRS